MPGKAGKLVVLKVSNGSSPTVDSFVTVGGARSHNVKKSEGIVDVSDKDSQGWSESDYLGLRTLEITQAGLHKGSVGEEILLDHIESNPTSPIRMQLFEPGRGTYEFNATVEREMVAPHDNAKEATYTIRNAGVVTFTADTPQS